MAAPFTTATYALWGTFADAASLPTTDPRLQAGALAWATLEAKLYVYDGTAWQPVGGGGTISGTIAANEVAFGSAPDTIGGSASLTYNSGTQDLTVGDGTPHSIRIGPYGYVNNPIIESQDSMNINVVNFSGALGIQAANNDLVLIGGDDGGGESYLQTQAGVRLEVQARATVRPAADNVNALTVRTAADAEVLGVDTTVPAVRLASELQSGGGSGVAGEVLTSNGPGVAPTWQASGSVTGVTASTPLASSGGATPNISLTGTVPVANGGTGNSAFPGSGQLLIGNGSGFTLATLTAGAGITITDAAGSVTVAANASAPQSIVLDATATGGTATIIGTIYVPAARTLTSASAAYIGGDNILDTTTLTLNPAGGGSAVATWTRTGTLNVSDPFTPGPSIPAGWYDLTLQRTAGPGTAVFARGLYLA